MSVSLIITTYNRPDALFLVLSSVLCQTVLPNEVIVADDGSDNATKNCIDEFRKLIRVEVIHSWQNDKGFRVARSRNKAISKSSSDYIVLIDGDVILHNKFIEDHIYHSKSGFFVQGSRALLSEFATKKAFTEKNIKFSFFSKGIRNRKNSLYSLFLAKIFTRKKLKLKKVRTCNIAFFKNDAININGFNNSIEGWGREDSEFVNRLTNSGIICKVVHFSLIQFHLWHHESNREFLPKNDEILKTSIDKKLEWCDSGLNKYL